MPHGIRPILPFGLAIWIYVLFSAVSCVSAVNLPTDATDEALTFSLGDDWSLSVNPGGDIYPPYIADLQRPGFAMMRMNMTDSAIPDAGDSRYAFMLGGQYGLMRLQSIVQPAVAFQVDIYGSFYGQFDLANSTDNIGWDGLYGIAFHAANSSGLAMKLAMQHDSSHVGDEYMARTGRMRIDYTRQEWALGLSYRFWNSMRVYGEGGYGFDLRNKDVQDPWRVQGGMEWETDTLFLGDRAGYYAAVNVGAADELDWEADITLQTGFVIPVRRYYHKVRIGLIYRDGRSLIGEFFQTPEKWWGIGLWLDI